MNSLTNSPRLPVGEFKYRARLSPLNVLVLGFLLLIQQACVVLPVDLPNANTIKVGETTGYDGIWMVDIIKKRIRIEGTRGVVIDPWIHWGKVVEKDMVFLINVKAKGAGILSADDLLNGNSKWEGILNSDGRLDVTLSTSPIPVKYQLIPITLDFPDFMDVEIESIN